MQGFYVRLFKYRKFLFTRAPKRNTFNYQPYYLCSNKKPEETPKPIEESDQAAKEQNVPKEAPSLIKDIMATIKESTVNTAITSTKKFKDNIITFKKEANSYDDTVGTFKTCINLGVHAWKKTFPTTDEEVRNRMERVKKQLSEERAKEEAKVYTEEELSKIQENIPEWKKTALQTQDSQEEKEKLGSKIKQKIAQRLNQTDAMKSIKTSEEFKEFTTFKSEMKQFKEDVKEKVQNHPSNLVQGSIYLYKVATTETDIAKAIKAMRLIDPDFDLFELEKEAKVIFQNTYHMFLQGDLKQLEKCCGEMALGYFKVLLKKREAEVNNGQQQNNRKASQNTNIYGIYRKLNLVKPQYQIRRNCLYFVFKFGLKKYFVILQKINLQTKNDPKKILDGDEERVMSMNFVFTLSPHMKPCVEEIGHSWEMVEIQPSEAIKLLV